LNDLALSKFSELNLVAHQIQRFVFLYEADIRAGATDAQQVSNGELLILGKAETC